MDFPDCEVQNLMLFFFVIKETFILGDWRIGQTYWDWDNPFALSQIVLPCILRLLLGVGKIQEPLPPL